MSEEEATKENEETMPEFGAAGQELPPPNFSTFVLSLSTSVLLDLGEIEHPGTGKKEQKLELAQHSIDMLAMFKDKTAGNLDEGEGKLISDILADLRFRYINAVKEKKAENE